MRVAGWPWNSGTPSTSRVHLMSNNSRRFSVRRATKRRERGFSGSTGIDRANSSLRSWTVILGGQASLSGFHRGGPASVVPILWAGFGQYFTALSYHMGHDRQILAEGTLASQAEPCRVRLRTNQTPASAPSRVLAIGVCL